MRADKGINKILYYILASVAAVSCLTSSVGALNLLTAFDRSHRSRNTETVAEIPMPEVIDSHIDAGISLTAGDAAMRLYYLGLISGSGVNINGGIDFALERGLNRVESAVFAVRFMGAETEANLVHYSHPFTDVPDWASDYVGYIYSCGLLDDLLESPDADGNVRFNPQLGESCERFSSYLLYALGYRMNEGDYTLLMAAEYAREIGICETKRDEPLTRGGAAVAMYNAMRTTTKGHNRVYSDVLVEKEVIDYNDAVFLIWNRDSREVREYLSAVGYGDKWILPNGYYKIKNSVGGKMLNVACSGMNSDYDGVGVTLWDNSEDITQTFRIERTERGTYYLYSAASKNGYGRVIGRSGSDEKAGLYRSIGSQAVEFRILGAADGTWTLVSDSDGLYLSAVNQYENGSRLVFSDNPGKAVRWNFTRQGIMNSAGEELAIFVAESLLVTQGAFDDYSHMEQNALDIQPTEMAVRAPFNSTVVRIDANEEACNAVWIESTSPVRYADGTLDYMTLCLLHDNDISDIYVGRGLTQGEYFYDSGDFGIASGKHVHVAAYRGRYNGTMHLGSGDVNLEDALFLPDDTYVYDSYGLDWVVSSLAD